VSTGPNQGWSRRFWLGVALVLEWGWWACGVGWKAFRYGRAVRFRYRTELWPVIILGVLFLARAAAVRLEPRTVFVVSALVSGVVLFGLRRKLDREHEWWYAGVCVTAVVMGLTLFSSVGDGYPTLNLMSGVAWVTAAGVWWWHHRAHGVPRLSVDELIDLWNKNVRKAGKALPGATIRELGSFEHGVEYLVQLVAGEQSLETATSAITKISSGLKTPMQNLVIEDYQDGQDPSLVRLRYITQSPIKDTVLFDRPRWRDGQPLLGPHSDGIGEAFLRIYAENSMYSATVIGETGSGKSALVNTVVATVRDPGFPPTVVWYCDGQDGASSPMLYKYADWAVGHRDALVMLSAVERVMDTRAKQNKAWGVEGFTPTDERPGLLIVIDEAHLIFWLAVDRYRNVATTGRKVGISFLVLDQDASLDMFKKEALRGACFKGGGVFLRVTSRTQGKLVPGLLIDPSTLPVLPGYGVLLAPPKSGLRNAPFRARYARMKRDDTSGEAVGVPSIEEWFESVPGRELDLVSARAAGPVYVERRARAERERAELLAWLEDPDTPVVESVPTGGERGPGAETEEATSTVDAILGLPWSNHPEGLSVQEIVRLLRETTGKHRNPSTITKALQTLRDQRDLVQDGPRQPYRRAETVGVS
jgi:hypothetical protein